MLLVGLTALGYVSLLMSDETLAHGDDDDGFDINQNVFKRLVMQICNGGGDGGGGSSGVSGGSKFHGTQKNRVDDV